MVSKNISWIFITGRQMLFWITLKIVKRNKGCFIIFMNVCSMPVKILFLAEDFFTVRAYFTFFFLVFSFGLSFAEQLPLLCSCMLFSFPNNIIYLLFEQPQTLQNVTNKRAENFFCGSFASSFCWCSEKIFDNIMYIMRFLVVLFFNK